ncbi:MAG: gamma-glutamyl-gamma-aminobutyrate hydrolase family protein [Burkholderiales bacterium]|nr:gamma-glutamyl-gamma-aminobutyrate hydrolase family protein [Burkholderiales bacterium]
MTVHVVQHTAGEYLGLVEDHLEGRGVRFRYWRPFAGGRALPAPEALEDGLVLLGGGPWGSAGTRDLPTLAAEVALARACLEQGKPVLGFGLGAQILALAAGGSAEPAPLAFAVLAVRRVSPDALDGFLPEAFPLAIYMRDRALPPPQAEILGVDEENRPAVWQIGARAFGFAGHPGVKLGMVEDLILEFDEVPQGYRATLDRLRAVQRSIEDALVPIMTGVVAATGWMRAPG